MPLQKSDLLFFWSNILLHYLKIFFSWYIKFGKFFLNFRGQQSADKKGLGVNNPHNLEQGDDEFDAYRKRMMLAYRFRPNPLVINYF